MAISDVPQGWYQVAYSDELRVGQVLPLTYFGRELALFRGEDRLARVFDAHCPHLGAHLAYGGKVEGCALRCPFHGWRFDGEGVCDDIPYATKIPPCAAVKRWPVVEQDAMLMVFYDRDGNAPSWQPPPLDKGDWTALRRERLRLQADLRDIAENLVDAAHFQSVHGLKQVPESRVEFEGPMMRSVLDSKVKAPWGEADSRTDIHLYGLGLSTVRFSGLIDTLLFTSVTPIDERSVDMRLSFAVSSKDGASTSHGIGKALVEEILAQVRADGVIWQHKIRHERPLLCAADLHIGTLRRWAQAFYREPTRPG